MSYPPLIDLRIGFWPVVHFIRLCSLFPIDNLSIYAQNFFEFCIHIVIGDEWYGIVNGQNPTIFDGVTALSPFKKWFLACFSFTVYDIWMKLHRYVQQQRLHITTKDRHSYLSSSWVICPWLILSISVLLLFRHYISHKITFGAPSSGGVLCSACGAFISPFVDQYWVMFPMGKEIPPNSSSNFPVQATTKNHYFVTSSLHFATANCNFVFQILKCAYEWNTKEVEWTKYLIFLFFLIWLYSVSFPKFV